MARRPIMLYEHPELARRCPALQGVDYGLGDSLAYHLCGEEFSQFIKLEVPV